MRLKQYFKILKKIEIEFDQINFDEYQADNREQDFSQCIWIFAAQFLFFFFCFLCVWRSFINWKLQNETIVKITKCFLFSLFFFVFFLLFFFLKINDNKQFATHESILLHGNIFPILRLFHTNAWAATAAAATPPPPFVRSFVRSIVEHSTNMQDNNVVQNYCVQQKLYDGLVCNIIIIWRSSTHVNKDEESFVGPAFQP